MAWTSRPQQERGQNEKHHPHLRASGAACQELSPDLQRLPPQPPPWGKNFREQPLGGGGAGGAGGMCVLSWGEGLCRVLCPPDLLLVWDVVGTRATNSSSLCFHASQNVCFPQKA